MHIYIYKYKYININKYIYIYKEGKSNKICTHWSRTGNIRTSDNNKDHRALLPSRPRPDKSASQDCE